MAKKTPLNQAHRNLGAVMVDFGGWDMPVYYTNVIDEHNSTRNSATVFDTCHMGEFWVEGKGAHDFLQYAITRNIPKNETGKMHLSVMCNTRGGILDDLTVYTFSPEKFYVVVNSSTAETDFTHLELLLGETNFDCVLKNVSGKTGKIDVQGPNAEKVLQKICKDKLSRIKYYEFFETEISGVPSIVSRSGYTGEDGFEVYCDSKKIEGVWTDILEEGTPEEIKPAGLGARDTLRLECAFNLYGNELDENTTPLESRYGWVVDFNKNNFVGKSILEAQRKTGVKKMLVGFEMIDKAVARHGYRVFNNTKEIGAVSSGSYAPTIKKNLGMCFVNADYSKEGQPLEIEVRDKRYKAKIVKLPFYKRKSE